MDPEQQNKALLPVKWFLLLQRAAFIANIFFLIYYLSAKVNAVLPQWIVGIILSIGYVLSPLLNIAVAICLVYVLLKGNTKPAPPWLITVNLCFLFFEFLHLLLSI